MPSVALPQGSASTTKWSSKYEGWHSRAILHPSPDTFTPTRSELEFAVLRSTPVEPEGFTLAIFRQGKIGVDAMGRVLTLNDEDYAGLEKLAMKTLDLPLTGEYKNTWIIKHPITDRPIDILLVGAQLKETRIQGFSKDMKELKRPTGNTTELSSVLGEFAGLVLEAREGYRRGEADASVIQKVKDVLNDSS